MIKILFVILFFISLSSFAGTSVVGTRFFITPETKVLNIKIMNDNESDYLIKTSINSDEFIVARPLFILPKNRSNIITIIPNNINSLNKDKIYKLVITAIPKSDKNNKDNIISLAVRSHFNVIYQYKKNNDSDFNGVKLIKDRDKKYWLKNYTDRIFNIKLSNDEKFKEYQRYILPPEDKIYINECRSEINCQVWISFLTNNDMIIKKIRVDLNH